MHMHLGEKCEDLENLFKRYQKLENHCTMLKMMSIKLQGLNKLTQGSPDMAKVGIGQK